MKKLFGLICSLTLIGCASLKPKEEAPIVLDKAIPIEIKEKFEVKEVSLPKKTEPISLPKKTTKKTPAKASPALEPKVEFRSYPTDFVPGESFKLSVKYLGVHAGNLDVKVLSFKQLENSIVYHFKANIYSAAFFSNVFKVNLLIESFVDKNSFFSRRYQISGDEGPLKKQNLELYDPEKQSIFEWKKEEKNGEITDSKNQYSGLTLYAQDLLSAFFYMRTLDFDKNSSHSMDIVSGNKVKKAKMTLISNTKVSFGEKEYDAWLIKFQLDESETKSQEITMTKKFKLITKIKADIKWGSFSVDLSEFSIP